VLSPPRLHSHLYGLRVEVQCPTMVATEDLADPMMGASARLRPAATAAALGLTPPTYACFVRYCAPQVL
jgi:hypothetical protein